jgi:hypothetical protein
MIGYCAAIKFNQRIFYSFYVNYLVCSQQPEASEEACTGLFIHFPEEHSLSPIAFR